MGENPRAGVTAAWQTDGSAIDMADAGRHHQVVPRLPSLREAQAQLATVRDRGHADNTTRQYDRFEAAYVEFCQDHDISDGIVTTADAQDFLRDQWEDFVARNRRFMSVSVSDSSAGLPILARSPLSWQKSHPFALSRAGL